MSDSMTDSSFQEVDLPKISCLDDLPRPLGPSLPTSLTTTMANTEPLTSEPPIAGTEPGQAATIDAGVTPIPSSRRSMVRQSSVAPTSSTQKRGSMDSLIDSLRPSTPSPSKGKSKAPEVQPVASSSDVTSSLPDYLVPPPQKKETVDAASKRADANLSLIDSKIDGVQALLSEEVKGIRTHLTQLATDLAAKVMAQPDHATRKTVAQLIQSHNKVVDTVRDLNGCLTSLTASTASVTTRLASLEAAIAHMDPLRMPAEKRGRYDDTPISTLVRIPSPIQPTLPQVGNLPSAYPSAASTTYLSPISQAIPNPPTQATRNTNNRHRAVLLGPMNWVNHREEVFNLLSMVPSSNTINKRAIQVSPSPHPNYVRITFGTPSDATSFTRTWKSSKPQEFSMVSVSFTSEN